MKPAALPCREIWFQKARNIYGYTMIYHVYTMYIHPMIYHLYPWIYHVYPVWWISMVYPWIQTGYTWYILGYTMYIPCISLRFTYTWYIPGIYQAYTENRGSRWMYIHVYTLECTYHVCSMYISVYTFSEMYKHVCTCLCFSIIVCTMSVDWHTIALYIHCTYMVQTCMYTFMPGGQDSRWQETVSCLSWLWLSLHFLF
jgi:hypothetical protein